MKFTSLAILAGCSLPSLFAAGPAIKCDQIATTKFTADVKINSAKLVPAAANLPEHCEIQGVIWPEAKFVVKLPSNWNSRFEMVGNGGWAGTITTAAVNTAVGLGYASTSTDTGHDAAKEPGAIFAMKSETNPNAARKVIDHGYLAVHETALLAKKMIRVYYGVDPLYSYWVGCSTGGRQGLMEAQRYPEDFDGYVVGAPVLNLTGLQTKAVWNWVALGPGAGEIKAEKLKALADGVYGKCDALDGLKDGIIENPLACDFHPERDLTACKGAETPDCFTPPQIAALKVIYDGPKNSKGEVIFPGFPPGGEAFALGARGPARSGWDGGMSASFGLGDTFMKYMAFDTPRGASWDYKTLNLDTDPAKMTNVGLIINATITDLSAVKARGGKVLHYHGWADPGVTPKMSVDYYEAVQKTMGSTSDFYRFFPVPGMFHCSGGPGCGEVDWLSAIVSWVEKGTAPTMLVGSHVEAGKTTRTRPVCMYPTVAHYKGSGSIDAAENFTCGPK
ncbi:MAG: tannase/feruloyl esterase family alpha/beta hydrolase [Acidobacteriota bacterium]